MTEIALAYSSMDKARAEAIAKVLGALGYTVSPQPVTAATVERAAALVVFWSAGSVNSIPINQLASQASCDRKLVSVRASHSDPPAAYALVALHDLSRWTGSLDAPELRTFLQHILRMSPPPGQAQQQAAGVSQARAPMSVGAGAAAPPQQASAPSSFAFAGPMGAATRPGESPRAFAPPPNTNPATTGPISPAPNRAIGLRSEAPPQPAAAPAPRPAPAIAPDPVAPPVAAPRRAEIRPQDRPAVRRAAERRRAKGGGAARVAMGAIAVSVIAGAAVAAFNYEPNQQSAKAAPDADATNLTAAVSVTPNSLSPDVVVSDATVTAPPVAEGAVQMAAVEPPPVATPDQAATLQSNRGWTASLPTGPAVGSRTAQAGPVATPVSAGAPAPQRRVGLRPTKLTPIDAGPAGPAPTDLVAVDGANLGGEPVNTLAPRPRSPEEERAWIRKNGEYGPAQ